MNPLLPALWSIAAGATIALAGPRSRKGLSLLGGGAMGLALLLSATAVLADGRASVGWGGALTLTAGFVPLSAAVALLVPFVGLAVVLYAALVEHEADLRRLVGLHLVFAGGMLLVLAADDLLLLLIGWEVIGATSWALIAHDWRRGETVGSAAWAFLLTRAGDVGLFVAVMALFTATESFAFAAIAELTGLPLVLVLAGVLVSAAAKAGQVPFSPWLFRAMDAPTSVSAFLHAAALVAAGAYLVARVEPLAPAGWFGGAAVAVGLATALAGGVVAVLQNHVKRLLAASTSAHLGLMFAAAGAGFPALAILHLLAHGALKAALFLTAGTAARLRGTYAMDRLRVGRALPVMAAISLAPTLALAGIPPLGGAFTKDKIVAALAEPSLWLAVLPALAGGLSAAYAVRFRLLVFGAGPEAPAERLPPGSALWPDVLLAALTIGLSVLWIPAVADRAAALLGGALPPGSAADLALSLALVAAGAVLGITLARHLPRLGTEGLAAAAADWLGLPALIERAVIHPFRRLARLLGRADDGLLDGAVRGLARRGRALAAGFSTVDDRVLDRTIACLASIGEVLAAALATVDDRVLDRGIAAVAAASGRLARAGDRVGERITDGLASGTAFLLSVSGRDLRRTQTGLAHQYLAVLSGGLAVAVLVFAFAG